LDFIEIMASFLWMMGLEPDEVLRAGELGTPRSCTASCRAAQLQEWEQGTLRVCESLSPVL
jgi:hypothetical protein